MTLGELMEALRSIYNDNLISIDSPVLFADCGGRIELDDGCRIVDSACAVVKPGGKANVILSDKEVGLWTK